MRTAHLFTLALLVGLPLVAAAQGGGSGNEFIPLLPSLPGIDTLQSGTSLAPFLSQVYKICIGLAAVLAVLQLMRAGVMYMGGDSITEKKEARELITLSIIGLLLVLSPVIVFTIINPKILQLDINASSLKTEIQFIQNPRGANGAAPAANTPAARALQICASYPEANKHPVVLATNQTCAQKLGPGNVLLDAQCCQGMSAGSSCCALDPNYHAPPPTTNLSATGSFSIAYQSRSDVTGQACLDYAEPTGPFPTISACQDEFDRLLDYMTAHNQIHAVGKTCTDTTQHTPVPSGSWNQIKNLPSCSSL